MHFTGVTRPVYDRLVQRAARMGLPAPSGPRGRVAFHNVEAEYAWNEGTGALEIAITRSPEWLSCAQVDTTVRSAIRDAGCEA
jgi:hypothetical protein